MRPGSCIARPRALSRSWQSDDGDGDYPGREPLRPAERPAVRRRRWRPRPPPDLGTADRDRGRHRASVAGLCCREPFGLRPAANIGPAAMAHSTAIGRWRRLAIPSGAYDMGSPQPSVVTQPLAAIPQAVSGWRATRSRAASACRAARCSCRSARWSRARLRVAVASGWAAKKSRMSSRVRASQKLPSAPITRPSPNATRIFGSRSVQEAFTNAQARSRAAGLSKNRARYERRVLAPHMRAGLEQRAIDERRIAEAWQRVHVAIVFLWRRRAIGRGNQRLDTARRSP